MIHPKQEKLQQMYPEMTDAFAKQMECLIMGLPHQKEEKTVKKVAFRSILAFTLMAALLCGSAYALISHGLEWYYTTRFTAYQQHEPEKHDAILTHLQTALPQCNTDESGLNVFVQDAAWVADQNFMVVSATAHLEKDEGFELHTYDELLNAEIEGTPILTASHKEPLFLDMNAVYYEGMQLLGDMSSYDAYVGDDGLLHTVVEIRMDFLNPESDAALQKQIKDDPQNAIWYENKLKENQAIRNLLQTDEDGIITLTMPYRLLPLSPQKNDPVNGQISFELKIR